ncbi:unnamed protein product, partial [Polarella glacialis]
MSERFTYPAPGGYFSVPTQKDYWVILEELPVSPPRRILGLVGWRVLDTSYDECVASLALSTLLALITVIIYVASSRTCCSMRARRAWAAERRADSQ